MKVIDKFALWLYGKLFDVRVSKVLLYTKIERAFKWAFLDQKKNDASKLVGYYHMMNDDE